MSSAPASPTPDAWIAAAGLLARWLEEHERVDVLLASLPPALGRNGRAHCQHLFYDAVRHRSRIEAALKPLLARAPRTKLQAALLITGGELLDAESAGADSAKGKVARIIHHAVERSKSFASPSEARLVNAVARKLAAALVAQPAPAADAPAADLAAWFSHPLWLVQRWLTQFGAATTRTLLEWNQRNSPVYARWRPASPHANPAIAPPAWLKPKPWTHFYEVPAGHWGEIEPLLAAGQLYLQDPSTRLAVELLAPQPGETILDLCAAPGGKSLLIADALAQSPSPERKSVQLVALDLPGPRIDRLKENLAQIKGVEVALMLADAVTADAKLFRAHALPTEYAAVLLDAPCTNTGVMRHRVDVKWRLQAGDFARHAEQQLALLHAAARLVTPGGRLVYSTCSLDAEENERVITAFFASRAGSPFKLTQQVVSYPWESGHDGAAAFLLRKSR